MRTLIAALFIALMLATGTANAQLVPFNDVGVTMGHWQIASHDIQAHKKIFLRHGRHAGPGRQRGGPVPQRSCQFDHPQWARIEGTVGSVVNHVGFIAKNVQEQTAQWKANGVPVLPGNDGRPDQAFVVTPDGVRIEILEDKTQPMPIRHEHVHFFFPESEIPKAQAWYAKTFGGDGHPQQRPGREYSGRPSPVW